MEDLMYETQVMSNREALKFVNWYDTFIGTDLEREREGEKVYFICIELVQYEVDMLRLYEFYHQIGDDSIKGSDILELMHNVCTNKGADYSRNGTGQHNIEWFTYMAKEYENA